MELVNERSPIVKFRKVDTTFRTESKNKKELMYAVLLTVNALHKAEMEYQHNIGRIQHIAIMIRIYIFTQPVV